MPDIEGLKNSHIYNALKQPPPEALKQIKGGRQVGKTDINPQWRYQAMTEQFGPCGIGWKFEITKLWTEPAPNEQIFAFAMVHVYIKQENQWSEAIPGCGGNMLVDKESAGLHANDEGYKMAITDALGTALKMIGVAADIYAGSWDGTKYLQSGNPTQKSTTEPGKQASDKPAQEKREHWCETHQTEFFKKGRMKGYAHPIEDADGKTLGWCNEEEIVPMSTEDDRLAIFDAAKQQGITNDQLKKGIKLIYKVDSTTMLTHESTLELIKSIETGTFKYKE